MGKVIAGTTLPKREAKKKLRPLTQPVDAPRPRGVNLARLESATLRRYQRLHGLRVAGDAAKQDLVEAVAAHFARQPVVESEVLTLFFGRMRSAP